MFKMIRGVTIFSLASNFMILQPGKKFLQGAIISLSKTQQNADAMPNSIDLERIMKPILKGNFVGDGIFVAKDNMSYFL